MTNVTQGPILCYMMIGGRLRELRLAKGLSQGDIGKRSGLTRSYISRVEGGHTVPSLATLEKFAKALEIEPSQLLSQAYGSHRRPRRNPGPRSSVRASDGKKKWQHLLLRNLVTEGYAQDEAEALVDLADS